MSKRSQNLKERVVIKTHRVAARGLQREEEGRAFQLGVKLCLERARLLTESYKQTESEPMVIRRAKALEHTLGNMTIYIQPDELIVGNFASGPEYVSHYPELQWRWLEKAVNNGYRDILDDEGKRELSEIHKYWSKRAIHGMERDLLPEEMKPYWYYKGIGYWAYYFEVSTPNYEKVFTVGLSGISKEVEERLKELKKEFSEAKVNSKEYLEKRRFLEAAIMALNAAIKWAKRYAMLASEMAQEEKDERRKEELEKIAEICNWVPENPPRTLHEALQCFCFIHYVTNFIESPQVGCGARFDKIFYPFYKKDVEEGRIGRDDAQELMELLFIKFQETGFIHPPIWSGMAGGGLGWQTVNIGGVNQDGEDITNEISYIVLDAMKSIRTIQPPLALRWHDGIPRELILKAIEVLSTGVAQPAIFNDKVNIPRFMQKGIPIEDARNYSIISCMWPTIPGKNCMSRASNTGFVLLPKCLEVVLNQGKDMKTNEQISIQTPDPLTFTSTEEIMEAVMQHYRFHIGILIAIQNIADALYEEYLPRPFLSAVTDGCIERAQDIRKWFFLPYRVPLYPFGVNNVADSLAAIKKLVFEEKKVTMEELIDALKRNWEGREELHQLMLSAPKFGNDDDYVDLIARELHYRVVEETMKFKDYFGTPVGLDGSAASGPYAYAGDTWATPDGRKAGEAFHDGSISPTMGRDKKGPTAAIKSVSKIDPLKSGNHLYNQTFLPQFLSGENAELFADYLKTWADLGIHHIQFSVVNKETLQDAQEHPERHTDLLVRVCGYSAYFIDLSRGLQDAVIARTQQHF